MTLKIDLVTLTMEQGCHACVTSASTVMKFQMSPSSRTHTSTDRQTLMTEKETPFQSKQRTRNTDRKYRTISLKHGEQEKRWFVIFFENGQTGEHWNVRDGRMTRLHVPFACNVCVCLNVNVCAQFWHYQRYSQRRRMRPAAGRKVLKRPFSQLKGFSGMVPGEAEEQPGTVRPAALWIALC